MTMATGEQRARYLEYLASQYMGPANGPEEAIQSRPDRTYLVGTLYPRDALIGDLEDAAYVESDIESPVEDDTEEAAEQLVDAANAWRPASAAMSFLHDGTSLVCTTSFGTYSQVEENGKKLWRRTLHGPFEVNLSPTSPSLPVTGHLDIKVASRWRRVAEQWLVTVAVQNGAVQPDDADQIKTEDCLFQVSMSCRVNGGEVQAYRTTASLNLTPEEEELALRYRDYRTYAVGHGASVRWTKQDGAVHAVSLDFLPSVEVPAIRPRKGRDEVLKLSSLAGGLKGKELRAALREFVGDYEEWFLERKDEADSAPVEHRAAAQRITSRMGDAVARMKESIVVLEEETHALSFRLAMMAMREQMLQTKHVRSNPGTLDQPLIPRSADLEEPKWHPFQLGFLLFSLASTADPKHKHRDAVDLIWFPTGGGKTEAYLALAAFEMIRRRLTRGREGGGTAVITRYTLRLLTTQQFQRASTLICALERLRATEQQLRNLPPFTIGLWLGDATTPNALSDAAARLDAALKAMNPKNPFQLEACPWCGTAIMPEFRTENRTAYGARATKFSFELHCPHPGCEFNEFLPVNVVDEQLYMDPPTMLMATVDKFAQLPMNQDSGALLGRGTTFDAPSLIIQDELHLLSGPLGTTVALYEAAIQSVISWNGIRPKIVASTATIRAASEQVEGLFAAPVALFPPSGLTADDSYFAEIDHQASGRLYVGLMPQAFTQSSAVVRSLSALLSAPMELDVEEGARDAYWTVVAYHNSLRELGRTSTIVRDDVESLLAARGHEGKERRKIGGEGVVELTSHVSSDELPKVLARLDRRVGESDVVDVAVSTNMLSVGIDVSRLGAMLMNGQPKTTAEYIQATSRVGRSNTPGLVVTLYKPTKPRDRSHYESFQGYHEALYRAVEPTSVTPWALQSRRRALAAALTLLVRHGAGLRSNESCAQFDPESSQVKAAITALKDVVSRADGSEALASHEQIDDLVKEWFYRAQETKDDGGKLSYWSTKTPSLLKSFGAAGVGWSVMNSMRSVDHTVRVQVRGE